MPSAVGESAPHQWLCGRISCGEREREREREIWLIIYIIMYIRSTWTEVLRYRALVKACYNHIMYSFKRVPVFSPSATYIIYYSIPYMEVVYGYECVLCCASQKQLLK